MVYNNFELLRPQKNQLVFDVEDDDISDNLFYEGVIVVEEKYLKKMIVSKYLN